MSAGRLIVWRHGRTEWNATGRFQGDSLTIEFDLLMQHSDYENAVYVLSP